MGLRIRTEEEWIAEYVERKTYWTHNGDMRCRHAVLRSGLHSSGFFNSRPVTEDAELLAQVASDIVANALESVILNMVNRVVGPQTGATDLAKAVAAEISKRRGSECKWAAPRKGEGSMYFAVGEEAVQKDEIVFLVEDVITTGGSVRQAANAAMDAGGTPITQVGCIVNRSGETVVDGRVIIALITKAMPTWKPGECELCAEGSLPLENVKDHWAELTKTY